VPNQTHNATNTSSYLDGFDDDMDLA